MSVDDDFGRISRMLAKKVTKLGRQTRELHDDSFFKDNDLTAVSQRNSTYNDFLTDYVANQKLRNKHQRVMKWLFFSVTLVFLCVVVVAMCLAVVFLARKPQITPADVAAILTAVGGVVASFIVLPKVIAENLFPSREDDKTADIFNSMIAYDMRLKDYYGCPSVQAVHKEDQNAH